MITLTVLLHVLAAVCFLLATIGIPASRINITALGLFFWVLATFTVGLR